MPRLSCAELSSQHYGQSSGTGPVSPCSLLGGGILLVLLGLSELPTSWAFCVGLLTRARTSEVLTRNI